ncbi:hypothetical protein, partial [Nocardia salmonicida]|uniref:hypothetical protein n=1 Tax=Nocardia salmonicida TaxID=53431 RepID=UPI003CE6EDD1
TMAGATGSDQTGWAGLLKNAEQGNLQLINVDGATLKKLTTGCENLVIDTMGLIKAIEVLDWTPLLNWTYSNQPTWPSARSHSTTLGSMQMMFTEYKNKSEELVTILRKHQAIITDMGNTFTAANKRYAIAEGESENSFKLPGEKDLSDKLNVLTDRVKNSNQISGGEWMNGPPKPTTGASGASFDTRAKAAIEGSIENAYSLIHFDFANIAELFDRNDGKIWEMAGKWNTVAQIWNTSIQTFGMNLLPTFKEQHWQGAGAERAAAFLDTYLKSANELQDAMDNMSKVLAATGDFNLYSWSHLPRYSQFHYTGKEVKDVNNWKAADALAGVRTWWEGKEGGGAKGYVDGAKQLAGMIPVFVDPTTRTGGGSGDNSGNNGGNGNNGGGNGSSGNNSGNNSGGNNGGGSGNGSSSG